MHRPESMRDRTPCQEATDGKPDWRQFAVVEDDFLDGCVCASGPRLLQLAWGAGILAAAIEAGCSGQNNKQ